MGDEQRQEVVDAVAGCVRQSQFLATKDLGYHVTASGAAGASVGAASESLLRLLNAAVACVSVAAARFDSLDDVTERYAEGAGDAVDVLLERADAAMDAARAPAAAAAPASTPVSKNIPNSISESRKNTPSRAVPRPQMKFTDPVDNSNKTPFVRKIYEKHNALRPLDYGMPSSGLLSPNMAEHVKALGISDNASSHYQLAHPYEYEINHIDYPKHMMEMKPEILYESLEATPFTFVDDVGAFDQMLASLETMKEIAVDLEHHDYRSFQGFTCLIQISTRLEDYIIDTLSLRSHIHRLNKVLSNPKIIKVFHGAEMDIIWLQRDFGCYVVGLFDTYHAAKVLELEKFGLGFLLKFYCGVETDKKYQLADWRVRPVPKEMMKYARMDTHYLLYIFDRMRNDIISHSPDTKQQLNVVLNRSETTALRLYEKEIYDVENGEGANGWLAHLRKADHAMTPTQVHVFKAIHAWRDHIARLEDESVRFVAPTHMLISIATEMPTTIPALRNCCHPTMPNLVKVYAQDLVLVVERAKTEVEERLQGKEEEARKLIETLGGKADFEKPAPENRMHTRFDAPQDNNATKVVAATKKEAAVTTRKLEANFKNESGSNRVAANIIVTLKSEHQTLLGSSWSKDGATGDFKARDQAEAVRASLYLVPPSFAKKRERNDENAAAVDEPKLKKVSLAAKKEPVTMESVVTVGKSKEAPTSVSEVLASAAAKTAARETKESVAMEVDADGKKLTSSNAIPALPGPAYEYPKTAEDVIAAAKVKMEKEGANVDGATEKKVFNPYAEADTSGVVGQRGQGPKGSRGGRGGSRGGGRGGKR